jgi:hypothetical protein
MFRVLPTKRFRKVVDLGGDVTTLKMITAGGQNTGTGSVTYSPARGTLFFAYTPGGGNNGVYETPIDVGSPITLRVGIGNSIPITVHKTLNFLYYPGSSSVTKWDLTAGTGANTNAWDTNSHILSMPANASVLVQTTATGTIRASLDVNGTPGARTSTTLSPATGVSGRGGGHSLDGTAYYVARASSQSLTMFIGQYNPTGATIVQTKTLPLSTSDYATRANVTVGPAGKFFMTYQNSIEIYDWATNTISTFAGVAGASSQRLDGSGANARFLGPRGMCYVPSLNKLVVIDQNYIRTITVPVF